MTPRPVWDIVYIFHGAMISIPGIPDTQIWMHEDNMIYPFFADLPLDLETFIGLETGRFLEYLGELALLEIQQQSRIVDP